jgi:hypothetical protein
MIEENSIEREHLQSSTLPDSGCVLNSGCHLASRYIMVSCPLREGTLYGHYVTDQVHAREITRVTPSVTRRSYELHRLTCASHVRGAISTREGAPTQAGAPFSCSRPSAAEQYSGEMVPSKSLQGRIEGPRIYSEPVEEASKQETGPPLRGPVFIVSILKTVQ